jgi:hypothetical protein
VLVDVAAHLDKVIDILLCIRSMFRVVIPATTRELLYEYIAVEYLLQLLGM